jgi:hypothetical protein
MRYSNFIISILVLVILLFPQFSLSQPSVSLNVELAPSESTSHFNIYTHDQHLASEIKVILQTSYAKISGFLADSLTEVVNVYVVNSEDEFRSLVGNGFPDWGVGCAIPEQNVIILKSPYRFKYYRPFSMVVTHELAHIFLGKYARGKRIPRWLDEGFAMHQSQEWAIGQDIAIARAVLTGSIIPLSDIESVNAFSQSKAELAYTESFLAVSFLYSEYGKGTEKELVTQLANGSSLDIAFLRTIGSNYLSFQLDFDKYLKSKYSWISILADMFPLWVGLAFLIVILYFLKRRYTKKTIREWELEEQGIKRIDEFSDDKTPD